jgi:hypothetical protein
VAVGVASASAELLTAPGMIDLLLDGSTAVLPMLLWPLWSVTLLAATFGYWLRRRGTCTTCSRGDTPAASLPAPGSASVHNAPLDDQATAAARPSTDSALRYAAPR